METSLLRGRYAAVALGIALAVSSACRTAPIFAPHVTLPPDKNRNSENVASAIKWAGLKYGWEMADDGPDHIIGTLRLRKHIAVVSIPYDADGYTIEYQDSQQLLYGNGKIHHNYNRWVDNLSEEARKRLDSGFWH